ncbi:MAG: TIGR00730 family Rossman fold protein, partial [Clostridia bacterium]
MNICLYGASSTELDARYLDAAYDLGRRIAAGGHTMVYGGGAQGVMGAAARGV